jgi:hypothetical protein
METYFSEASVDIQQVTRYDDPEDPSVYNDRSQPQILGED